MINIASTSGTIRHHHDHCFGNLTLDVLRQWNRLLRLCQSSPIKNQPIIELLLLASMQLLLLLHDQLVDGL